MRTDLPPPALSEIITNALRYWESRRIRFNVLLIILAFGRFLFSGTHLPTVSFFKSSPYLFLFLIQANLAYCLCYLPDVFVQLSEFRSLWLRRRFWIYGLVLLYSCIVIFQQAGALILLSHNMQHLPKPF